MGVTKQVHYSGGWVEGAKSFCAKTRQADRSGGARCTKDCKTQQTDRQKDRQTDKTGGALRYHTPLIWLTDRQRQVLAGKNKKNV